MSFDFTAITEEAKKEIAQANDLKALEQLRIKYLGRRGLIAEITGNIPNVAQGERPEFGKNANILKNSITKILEEKISELNSSSVSIATSFDFTLPGIKPRQGTVHPITRVTNEICTVFKEMGFAVVEGPEVETEYNNFTGLNIPLEHPSRDAFDTFYLDLKDKKEKLLLRSQTSPVQIRVMKKYNPPLAVIAPGKVYRPDATDASHSFMFHQIEGFLVDKDVKFSDLKGVLSVFAKKLFGSHTKMRFRPHFFPFTEPSAEVDISCIVCNGRGWLIEQPEAATSLPRDPKGFTGAAANLPRGPKDFTGCSVCGRKGWLEILGSGMIHPNVFKNVGYKSGKYSGFAFGMGIDRIAMLKYGIDDIRLFFENDLRFLRQF